MYERSVAFYILLNVGKNQTLLLRFLSYVKRQSIGRSSFEEHSPD